MTCPICLGSAAGVQSAVWLRLGVLPALLPLVYLDREPSAAKNLRPQLAGALFSLLCSTHMTQPASEGVGSMEGMCLI